MFLTNTTVLEPRFTMAGEEGKVAASIRTKLTERFKPEHLEVNFLEQWTILRTTGQFFLSAR